MMLRQMPVRNGQPTPTDGVKDRPDGVRQKLPVITNTDNRAPDVQGR